MVGRAGCCSQRTHFFDQESGEFFGLQNRFGFLKQRRFVGGTAAFIDEEKPVFVTRRRADINLGGQGGLGIYLGVHVQRGVLGVA